MELFRAEMVAEAFGISIGSTRKCRCGGTLELIRKILDSETGRVVHMYRCECGDRTWNEECLGRR